MRGPNRKTIPTGLLLGTVALALGGCGQEPPGSPENSFGAAPDLPAPKSGWWPTVNIARATGWPAGAAPKAAPGLVVSAFATGLDHPRWLSVLPNGDVLVAETNAPDKPDDGKGIKGYVEGWVMWAAGATVPSPNRITLLRPKADGTLESRSTFLSGLNSPFGMTLVGESLYVADSDALLRFPYKTGDTSIATKGEKVADLPAGRINHHWTKDVAASPDGKTLFITVGSNSNVAENGIAAEENRAAVLAIDPADGKTRVFASGLRNPNGLSFEPQSKALWVVVNERDEIGDDLVPDYMTSVKEGAFYGWPYSWYGQHVDVRVQPPRPDLVARAIPPDYALGAHTASLGLTFDEGSHLPADFTGGAFVGQHGSWNRTPRSGYKVIFVPFTNGKPDGKPRDVLTGFLSEGGQAQGRPVGVRIDTRGGLLVADDVGNTIWRVTAARDQDPS